VGGVGGKEFGVKFSGGTQGTQRIRIQKVGSGGSLFGKEGDLSMGCRAISRTKQSRWGGRDRRRSEKGRWGEKDEGSGGEAAGRMMQHKRKLLVLGS